MNDQIFSAFFDEVEKIAGGTGRLGRIAASVAKKQARGVAVPEGLSDAYKSTRTKALKRFSKARTHVRDESHREDYFGGGSDRWTDNKGERMRALKASMGEAAASGKEVDHQALRGVVHSARRGNLDQTDRPMLSGGWGSEMTAAPHYHARRRIHAGDQRRADRAALRQRTRDANIEKQQERQRSAAATRTAADRANREADKAAREAVKSPVSGTTSAPKVHHTSDTRSTIKGAEPQNRKSILPKLIAAGGATAAGAYMLHRKNNS